METKPSIFTSEFWMTFVLQVILTLNTVNVWNFIPEKYKWASVLAQAIIGAFYVVARGLAKQGVGADPAVPANKKLFLNVRRKDVSTHS